MNVLEWPGNSPGLDSVEKLWAIVKQRPQSHDFTTPEKLQKALFDVWYQNVKVIETCKTLIESMPKSVSNVPKNHGGHFSKKSSDKLYLNALIS